MSETDIRKKMLRTRFLRARNELSPEQRKKKSRMIRNHLSAWKLYQEARTIHCFLTIEKNAEVDTGPILDLLTGDGKKVVVPRTIAETKELEHYVYQGADHLKVNSMGIPEPFEGRKISPDELDLVLVPMIAADLKKNRLGYGLGYYDRFLAKTAALKVGLLFEAGLSGDRLPVNRYDVPLDYLITEKGIY